MLATALLVSAAYAVSPNADASALNPPDRNARLRLHAELGSLAPIKHVIQFDKTGTEFDYIADGGQDNLFLFARLSADLDLGDRNTFIILYQPLDLQTDVRLDQELRVDGAVFAEGTPMELRYGFDFVRGSWLRDLQASDERELAVGLSLQIRNATIDYVAKDGSEQRSNRDIGPVPILKMRTRQPIGETAYWGAEVDGFYAPVSYLNGDNNEVVGAIIDASGRAGMTLNGGADVFLNLRTIAGGAEGIDDDSTGPGDGYTRNWLTFAALSLGFTLR
jgi:hypothetical protein